MNSESDSELFITQSKYQDVNSPQSSHQILNSSLESPNFSLKNDIFSDISDFEEDNDALIEVTQKAEMETASTIPNARRFAAPLAEKDIQKLVTSAIPQNTANKTKWVVRVFNLWKNERNNATKVNKVGELLAMEKDELNSCLCYFVSEVRNLAGKEYYPNTLYEIIISLQHYLRENNIFVSFLDDNEFTGLRKVLDARMKELSKKSIGLVKKQAEIITVQQENILWEKNILGADNPRKLVNTLVYCFGLNFTLRAGQEHRNLRIGIHSQLNLKMSNTEGRRYIEYTEDISKTNLGGIHHRKVEPKITRVYENVEKPSRCVVKMYEKYMALRPKDGKSTAFYLRPKKYETPCVWYEDIPTGVHVLQQTVGKLCAEAGFTGHYTNHSLRATAATRLYDAGGDEQLICEKTGHRSNAVRSYKRTSEEQLHTVNDIVQTKSRKCDSLQMDVKSENIKSSEGETNVSNAKEITVCADGISVNIKF